jgi:predicted ATP-binding protein involved in virulence
MKINSFTATGVHGYLKFDLDFYSELTFLIGINGSGKTSALKLILGLTSPSFQYLSKIDFDVCCVVCSTTNDEKDILIKAEKFDIDHFILSITLNGETHSTSPIEKTASEWNGYDSPDIPMHESRLRDVFDSSEITKKIRELATPKYLGLDRRVYEGRLIDYKYAYTKHRHYIKSVKSRNGDTVANAPAIDYSLDEVQQMVYDYTRKIAQAQPMISEDFKQKIFKQSFSFPDSTVVEPIPSDIETITKKKGDVLEAINSLGMGYLNSDIINYFKKIENLVTQHTRIVKAYSHKNPKAVRNESGGINGLFHNHDYVEVLTKWYNNVSQLKRIDEIISFSEAYQEKINELRTPIKRLELIVTNFLSEGHKQLAIDPDGEIRVVLKNGNSASIYELSSGEKQIIIMIAHLIFEEDVKPSGIFIIDEPELSLHIAWQQIFVDSIIAASPKTQFILATHAPAIISKAERELLCQDLNKINL